MLSKIFSSKFTVLFIFAVGAVLRFIKLDYQGLWFDEIYVMNVANPANGFNEIMKLMHIEYHPPLQFLLDHLIFRLFGFSDFVARLTSATIGMLGLVAVYWLGKEIKNRELGNILAILTAVNYFHIYHSQEVRMYITLFLFSTLSALMFIKVIKKVTIYSYLLWGLFTILNLYTHYFSFFVLFAQGIIILFLMVKEKDPKRSFYTISTFVVIILCYLPWIPFIIHTGQMKHWMQCPKPWFIFDYLYNLFGKEPISTLIFMGSLFYLIRQLIRNNAQLTLFQKYTYSYLLISIVSIFYISYVVSMFKPVLQLRCTIAALPFLIAIMGIVLADSKLKIKYGLLVLVFMVSLINLVFLKHYYSKNIKEDYRGLVEDQAHLLESHFVISPFADYFQYYVDQNNLKASILDPINIDPEKVLKGIDTLLVLNAHIEGECILNSPLYVKTASYINSNYSIKETYFSTKRKNENIVMFVRNGIN